VYRLPPKIDQGGDAGKLLADLVQGVFFPRQPIGRGASSWSRREYSKMTPMSHNVFKIRAQVVVGRYDRMTP
jgi:hypothetical protein